MNMTTVSLAVTTLLAWTAVAMSDVARVRVEVEGIVYTGELQPEMTTRPVAPPPPAPAAALTRTFSGQAPFAIHLSAGIDPKRVDDVAVSWNFGDERGTFNTLEGFNASHVYDTPGIYVAWRTIRDQDAVTTEFYGVEVTASTRDTVYVSADGNDSNNGTTPALAVRSFERAIAMARSSTAIRFRRGDTFPAMRGMSINAKDVILGAYGNADLPKPLITTTQTTGFIHLFDIAGESVLIEDLAFDAPLAKPFDKTGTPDVIVARGVGLVVRNCTFYNVNYGINGNGNPRGVLLQSNSVPLETGLRSYLAWVQGADWTILGNDAVNSTREHIVRVGGADRLNIQFNRFTNIDRREVAANPDKYDTAKAALNIQKGSALYAANNILTGPNGVGPLGGADGMNDKSARWIGAIVENNRIDGFFQINHGAEHVLCKNNFVRLDNLAAFPISGFDNNYGRGVENVRLEQNTAINAGKQGNFVTVGWGAKDIALVGNLYVAPNLVPGGFHSAAVYVNAKDLSQFTQITNNVWPIAKPNAFAQNGINYVDPEWGKSEGYRDVKEWNALKPVVNDRQEQVSIEAANDAHTKLSAGADVRKLPPTEGSK